MIQTMKKPWGKRQKTAEQNADCWLYGKWLTTACHKVLETGSKPTEEKKCEKYTERLGHILAGSYKKIPNTFTNQLKIA